MTSKMYGPKNENLWLNRPVGYWANQLLKKVPSLQGPKRCGINYVTEIRMYDQQEIDLAHFKQAVEATVYNEPHLRTDVDLSTDPARWVPATDFSQLFSFMDKRNEGVAGVTDLLPLIEKETNSPWQYGSGKPLYRCTLIRAVECYVLMNYYHNAAADCTSGMIIIQSILKQYDALTHGKDVYLKPEVPRPSVELYTSVYENKATLSKMLEDKASRLENYKPYLPFTYDRSLTSDKVINKTLFKDGDPEVYVKLLSKCNSMGLKVSCLVIAASYLAMAAVHAKWSCQDIMKYEGMKDEYIDIPVNVRSRITPSIGNTYCGFYVTEVTTKESVYLRTTLWSLARKIAKDFDSQVSQNRHLLYSEAKRQFECGAYKERVISHPVEWISDLLISDEKEYFGQQRFDWGKIESVHSAGSWCTPGFSNYLFLIQSTEKFHYDMVYLPLGKNTDVAKQLLDYIVHVMEVLALQPRDPSLADILQSE